MAADRKRCGGVASTRVGLSLFAVAVALVWSVAAYGQPAEDDATGVEVPLVPEERVIGLNPSDAHVEAMRAVSDEEISAATQRANRLDEAVRMTAGIDLLFGIGSPR